LNASTRKVIANEDAALTNAEVFAADFFPKLGLPREQLMPLFDDFYLNEYRELRAFIEPIEGARQVVERAFAEPFTVAIATTPIFPRVAIQQRLEWGGLGDYAYALITDYETFHTCKPNPAYYKEIAARIQIAPNECLMVGNDVQADILPARRAGMKTFWITDAGELPTDVPTNWRGTLADLEELIVTGLVKE
jgi:FMN phosphatase YigB (HAD superfamily)